MVCVAGEVQGVLEIWDLSRGGDEPLKRTLEVSQSVRVGEIVIRVSCLCERKIGSFGLILQWDRNKVDLMDVVRERTIGDVGVDFTSGTTYTLLITEWPSSPSEGDDEQIELSDKDTRKLTEVGVDLSSPSTVMLLVTETAESPNAETGTKASTPTDDCPPATTYPTEQIWGWPNKKPEGDGGTERDQAESDECGRITFDSKFWSSECVVERASEWKGEIAETETDQAGSNELGTVMLHHDKSLSTRRHVKTGSKCEGEISETETGQKTSALEVYSRKPGRAHRYKFDIGYKEQQRQEDNEPNQRSDTGYVGLVNQAMTCYLNSLLQALYMTPEFRNALYNWEYDSGSEKDEAKSIPYQLQTLFLNLQTSTKNAIETTSLTKSFGWDSTEAWQQHDIQELCRVMFDALEQTFKKTEQADLINRLYEGKMIDYVKCLECGTEKSREDTFLDIPLPVKPFGSNVAYNSVEEALAAFVQPETLDGTNQYHCETCNKKCDAHKGLKFTKFPYLLTLHLKRFDFDYNTFHRIKLNDEVTFPDILNLNSFIPSTASQDSPCADEDGGVGVKCDDSSTTDSGTLDDECPPCDNGMSVSDHSMNQDHDDDEGIDMSNGPSTSNCTTHNHNEKNRGNRQEARGPYEYELFSIMIHSGSASGGHYYAYIKDFKTGEWLCFNDQNVSPITEDDIQKTYGGGPARAYYSGVYSSSTNAYMLMYRQIDPVRNTLPMQVAAFPKHLQELLVKMQECEYNEMKNREMLMQMYRLRVFCHRPNEKTLAKVKLFCLYDETWAELTERAYNSLSLENVVDRDQVRLVTYQESTGLIECSFDGREHETLRAILEDQQDLLLEIRKKDEKFQTYLPGGLPTKVYVVDVAKKEVVKGPINVRGLVTQTVLEYKEQLGEILGMEPKDIQLILQYPINPTIRLVPVANDDVQLQFEGFSCANKIFVPKISDTDATKSIQDSISEINEVFGSLISFTVELPDTSKEALRALSIPSLEEISKDKPLETPVTNSSTKSSSAIDGSTDTTDKLEASATTLTTKAGGDEVPGFRNETTSPSATQPEGEEWHTPEQSNSEDSSLSYSDRTLVGEGDASEDDDYPLANVDNEFFSQTEQENWDVDDAAERFFKAERDEDDEKLLRVVVDKKMILGTLKKLLEPYIGVPANWFKIYRQCIGETECNHLGAPIATKFQEGDVLCVKLGRALRSGEHRAKLYQMTLDSEGQNFTFLCECIVSKNATVGQTKKEILVELKKRFEIDIPFERCRLRRKNNKIASSVFLNDQKFKDLHHNWPFEIIVQELPGKEPVTDPNDVVLFVRRVMKPDAFLGPIEELVVSGKSIAELREKLSEISGIPEENLEMAKGKSTVSWDVMMLMFEKVLDWNRQSTQTDNHPPTGLEDGTFIYYRDWREKATEPASEDSQYGVTTKPKSRLLGISSSPRYSPRRERALKIYVDDK